MDSYLSSSDLNNSPLVTVAVITRNRADSLKRTLDAIKQLDYSNYEVLVVDNASTDHTKEVIYNSGYKYLFSKKNNGFAKTRQIAVDTAKGEYICWCDDDCVPDPDWIAVFVTRFETDPKIALIGGGISNHGFPEAMKNKGKEVMGTNGKLRICRDNEQPEFFANLNMAIRTKSIKEIGGYDLFFKGGYEEVDLVLAFKKAGYEIVYEPDAHVHHYHSNVSFKKGRFLYGASLMRLYLYFKYQEQLQNDKFSQIEASIFLWEINLGIRLFLSGLKRKSLSRINAAMIEVFNTVTARLSIPFLIFKFSKS